MTYKFRLATAYIDVRLPSEGRGLAKQRGFTVHGGPNKNPGLEGQPGTSKRLREIAHDTGIPAVRYTGCKRVLRRPECFPVSA